MYIICHIIYILLYDVFLITTLGHLTVLEIWQLAALDSAPLFLKPMLAALTILHNFANFCSSIIIVFALRS